jgi:carbohydrate-selective porin OprB
MKLSSLIVAATMVATAVEGKHKKNGAKSSKNGTGGGTSFVGFGGKASKGAKGGSGGSDNNWWSPTKDKFDVCAVANPIENQIEILGDQLPGVEHAYAVYTRFADAVKGYNSGGKFCNTLGEQDCII